MPGVKPTHAEVVERIEYTRELLIRALHGGQIKQALRAKYGPLSHATCGRYVSRARHVMVEEMGMSRDEARGQALERYEAVIRDKAADHYDRIRAQERIDKILGLETPQRIAHEGKDGAPIQIETRPLQELPREKLLELAEKLSTPRIELNGNGHANGNGTAKA